MENKKKLDQSSLENSQLLYSENDDKNINEANQKYQEELQKYENQNYKNKTFIQSNNANANKYHFNFSALPQEGQNNIINSDNISNYTFGQNKSFNLSESGRFNSINPLENSKNINQAALNFEDSNILNSSHLDLTNSISIKKECNLITKCPYVAFSNNYGDNSCYVNVVLHLLFNITDLHNIFRDLYEIDEMEKQNPKEKNKNKDTQNIDTPQDINTDINKTTNNENEITTTGNVEQSNNYTIPEIYNLFVEIGEILADYEVYLNEANTISQVTILDTRKLRTRLEKVSNGLFPLNYVADPVELFIFILDNLNLNYQREIHSNFHMELIDKVECRKKCPNSYRNNYDKDNFLYHIYVNELINYLQDNAIKFKISKGDLFHLSYSLYIDDKKECEKCTLLMDKYLICLNNPKYLLINCVWNNQNPKIKQIVDFLFLLSIEEDINNLFVCQNRTKSTDTNYHLLGMILYSYTLCHYTVLIFNKKQKVFALYNDNSVKEFKTIYDAFPEMLIDNVNLYDNDKAYFYPVMLIYSKEKIYNNNDIKNNILDEKQYVGILNKIEENQKLYIQKHTLTEEQKKKNLEELIEKQKAYEQEMNNKKSNNNKKNNIKNIDMNMDIDDENNNNTNNNNNEVNWMNYNFEDDKKKQNRNQIINNNNNNDLKMTSNDYKKIYGNDLLKNNSGIQEYKNYFNELNNLNIDDLVNKNSSNNNYGNNIQNDYLKNIHEQSNSSSNFNLLESSQRININNNNYFNNKYDDIEENNRLAQSHIISTTKYFDNFNKKYNKINYNQQSINTPMGNNINTNVNYMGNKSNTKVKNNQQNIITPMGSNTNNNVKNSQQNIITPMGSKSNTDIKNSQQNIITPMGSNKNNNVKTNQQNIITPMGNKSNTNVKTNQQSIITPMGSKSNTNANYNRQNIITPIGSKANTNFNNIQQNTNTPIENKANTNNNQRKNVIKLSSSQQININNQNNLNNSNKKNLFQNTYNLDNNFSNNNKQNLAKSNYNISTGSNYINRANLSKNQDNKGSSIIINNRSNLANSQTNVKTEISYHNRSNLPNSQNNIGSNINANNRINMAQSQIITGNSNRRPNLDSTQTNVGNNSNNINPRTYLGHSQNTSGKRNNK